MNPGFYKYEEEDDVVGYAPNFVLNANFELRKETKDEHEYPTDGWYWFDDEDEAYAFLGAIKPQSE